MNLDRTIALLFLIIALIYGFSAFHFPILPFERNMAFLPNTLPKALSIVAALVSLFILISPNKQSNTISLEEVKGFDLKRTFLLVASMIAYAILLRPLGFIGSTILFIVGTSTILGERKFVQLTMVALLAAFLIWYLVQQTLGIYLSPWPRLFNG